MTAYPPFAPRRASVLPAVVSGVAFVLAFYLLLDRSGLFTRGPDVNPRPVAPRGDLMEIEKTTTSIFERLAPSVVHITTEALARTVYGDVRRYPEGTGTGFLWDDSGTVVTNYHVVKTVVEAGSQLKVALGEELFDGAVVGTSPRHDIAVLRIVAPPHNLAAIPIGTSADLKVGQYVLAIGNPFGFDRSLSTGTISALNRSIGTEQSQQMDGLIQTDAAINPGNSGGPLLDSAGRLIGMNTAIYSPSGSSAGIGFAVPVDIINEVVPSLLDGTAAQRHLGVTVGQTVRVDRSSGFSVGVPVLGLEPGAGAEAAGIQPFQVSNNRITTWGDIIVAIDGTPVRNQDELRRMLRGRKRGETVSVKLVRGEPDTTKVVDVPVALK
ncbi:MAG: trypsin-like peptidase domain-containing protein [Planctomycetes bacterium]|nr:trypsin-like peptidase domain-containing protein [Planctomycetota bacterium]